MNELPDKIVRFDFLQIKRDMNKLCKCHDAAYIIDAQNHLVYCQHCRGIVDPFEAMSKIARNYEQFEKQSEIMLEERRKLERYKPHLIALQRLERNIGRDGEMVPCCPNCKQPFYLSELTHFANKRFLSEPILIKEE